MPRTNKTDDIYEKISDLPDIEKLKLVDRILIELDKPDPEMDKIWEQEAKRRWSRYKNGKLRNEKILNSDRKN